MNGRVALWTRSLIAEAWLATSLLVLGLAFAPVAALSRRGALWAMKIYCAQAFWALRIFAGVRVAIRGPVPAGRCVVAAKHQSFLDVMMLMQTLPEPVFVMKRSLVWAPIVGLYALRIGATPIDRSAGAAALRGLRARMADIDGDAQIVVFPQGTRVAPRETAPYRRGALLAADALGAPIIPAATNAGAHWARRALLKRPGVAVMEFGPEIDGTAPRADQMRAMEEWIETRSAALLEATG